MLVATILLLFAQNDAVLAATLKHSTDRVSIDADWEAIPILERLAEIIEASLPVFERELGYSLPANERMVFHLYTAREDFDEAISLEGTTTVANAATLVSNRESYVVMQPMFTPASCGPKTWPTEF